MLPKRPSTPSSTRRRTVSEVWTWLAFATRWAPSALTKKTKTRWRLATPKLSASVP
ncbi:hypothetical protein PF002_g20395 [Phytophthora fragariae]|uniref:Uncharacterized protein n=1 Tax=Phytophthora fragariae TaxID=53985 RepID=A0A6A3XXX8_9STRA|nr:hypothetical protein PF002_g20395 [Phytophthora fragariae]KAE9213775.1 hypothetical protein PF004_g15238 [Phytophthora fragariae]